MLNKIKSGTAHKRTVLYDKLARIFINIGGFTVIIAVVGILVFILWEGLPLLFGTEIKNSTEADIAKNNILFAGTDEYQEIVFIIKNNNRIEFLDIEKSQLIDTVSFSELVNRKQLCISSDLSQRNFAIGLDSGFAATLKIEFDVHFNKNNERIIEPSVNLTGVLLIDSLHRDITKLNYILDEDGSKSIVAVSGDDLIYYTAEESFSLIGDNSLIENRINLKSFASGIITNFVLSNDGTQLVLIENDRYLKYLDLRDKEDPNLIQQINIPVDGYKITGLKFLVGDQSIIFGDSKGRVYSLGKSLDEESPSGFSLVRSHTFETMDGSVTSISPSSQSKNFLVSDEKGNVNLYYLTSERLLLSYNEESDKIEETNFSYKSDGFLIRYSNGVLVNTKIINPHPEVSIKTLFGKVLYEGYKEPEFVWQSTGGDDSFESKFSLIPLLFGTTKGTLYAMIFAIPLALLGALYTSTFAHPTMKSKIKPVVELMAALPSVVIGFLAGLWLAPILEEIFPGMVLMFMVQPVMIVLGVAAWKKFDILQKYVPRGYEVFLIIPFLIVGAWISIELGPLFEQIFFSGDYRIWLNEYLNENYDQRNSLVVGFAMGFAVIPIIFTIAEDSLSTVPQHLSSASLALGASKWQTAIRVVLPTASPGIFSAIMIGFGRAIGETMIVLMATGNTPIMDLSPFNGMRTLAANIAVEIPEAPYQGTLYRVLFVSAALLFIMTFIVNTVAEIVRQRLRKKYMHI